MMALLDFYNVVIIPLANPDGCYEGRMNSNAEGIVVGRHDDKSIETQSILALLDEIRPVVMINNHGWGNEIGTPPFESVIAGQMPIHYSSICASMLRAAITQHIRVIWLKNSF